MKIRIESFLHEITFTFARSSGPGGQNVNKVNSKALLRWNIRESSALTDEARSLLFSRLSSFLNSEDEVFLASDRHRDQIRNKEECLRKLEVLLEKALTVRKSRKKTKPSKKSVKKAKESKRRHSEKKRMRRIRNSD